MSNEIVPCYSSLFYFGADFAQEGREATERRNLVMWYACLAEGFRFWAEKPTVYYFGWMRLVGCYEHFLGGNPLLFQPHALKSSQSCFFGIWVEEGGVCVKAQCWQEEMFSRSLTDSDLLLSLLLMLHSPRKPGIELFLQPFAWRNEVTLSERAVLIRSSATNKMTSLRSEGRKTGLLPHWSMEPRLSPCVLEETRSHQPTCSILPLSWIVVRPGKDSCSALCLAPYHSLREG